MNLSDIFLADDLLIAVVIDSRAAILFRSPQQQVALRAGFTEGFAVHMALLASALRMRSDLRAKQSGDGLAKKLVLGLEDHAVHSFSARSVRVGPVDNDRRPRKAARVC
jgi:hypothetical protein